MKDRTVIKKKPPKIENLLGKIKKCLDQNRYTQTEHAIHRQNERQITLAEAIHVLLTGYEEKNKTSFDTRFNTWKYAIRGKTKIDKLDVRVIISFDVNDLLIITVMYVGDL